MFWFTWIAAGASLIGAMALMAESTQYAASKVEWAASPVRHAALLIFPMVLSFLGCPFTRLHSFMLAMLVALGGSVIAVIGGLILKSAIPVQHRQYRNLPFALSLMVTSFVCVTITYFIGLQPDYS